MIETTLQTAAVAQALPDPQTLALALVCLLAGMTVPTGYGLERLNGFGRAIVSKLPYKAPPGQEAAEAMQQAADQQGGGGQ
jgi:hypothetical protein